MIELLINYNVIFWSLTHTPRRAKTILLLLKTPSNRKCTFSQSFATLFYAHGYTLHIKNKSNGLSVITYDERHQRAQCHKLQFGWGESQVITHTKYRWNGCDVAGLLLISLSLALSTRWFCFLNILNDFFLRFKMQQKRRKAKTKTKLLK